MQISASGVYWVFRNTPTITFSDLFLFVCSSLVTAGMILMIAEEQEQKLSKKSLKVMRDSEREVLAENVDPDE